MTSKLEQFFEETGTLAQVSEVAELRNSDLFFNLVAGGFDICVEDRIRFEHRIGAGTTCLCVPGTTAAEIELWHKGSVMGVAAWLHGLLALHVSAVQSGERLVALAGDSGAGKSTLAAALGRHGFPLFADDTLVLDRDDGTLVALPGHKKLKLWDNAFDLARSARGARLQPGVDKYFADNASVSEAALLPLTDVVLLVESDSDDPVFRQVTGSEKLKRCADVLYRPELYVKIASPSDHTKMLLELSKKLRFWEFSRSRNRAAFEQTTKFIAEQLRKIG